MAFKVLTEHLWVSTTIMKTPDDKIYFGIIMFIPPAELRDVENL